MESEGDKVRRSNKVDDMLKVVSKRIQAMMNVNQVLKEVDTGEIGYYKYVRVNGQYRFTDATVNFEDHKFLSKWEPVEGAATIKIYPKGIKIEGYSSSLNIGPCEQDYVDLPKLFNRPLEENW